MKKIIISAFVGLAVLLAVAMPAAYAVLERVGPVSNDPAVGGYPAWYQDTTGLALEFCDPKNLAEVAGGWCLLLPDNVPAPPEAFPGEFFDEHFFYSAGAVFTAGTILWETALEAAFAADVAPGGQIVFTRIRVRFDAPVAGTYTITHPYGVEIIDHPGGGRIFFTDDVGINCPPGQFQCAMEGRVGPFLLPSNTPGGVELPPVPGPVPGKLYIADPAREGPITGSPTGTNFVRIQGPAGSDIGGSLLDFIETSDFTLVGRVFQGTIGSQVTVDRASYADPGLPDPLKVDVFVTAFPSTQGRIPSNPAPPVITPQLQYYDAACVVDEITGALSAPPGIPTQMFFAGPGYWGQSAPATVPMEVCVQQLNAVDAGGNTVAVFFPSNVGDQVFITEALYDPINLTLSVMASSSDQAIPPTLTAVGFGDLTVGQLTVDVLNAPPSKVRVTSSARGANEFQVSTLVGATGGGTVIPVAVNDTATVPEDSGATSIPVLTNDTVGGLPIPVGSLPVLVALPPKGTAAVNTLDGTISYTPDPNASGADSFTYTVTVGGFISNVANVAVTITPFNDLPVAVDDQADALAGFDTLINVLANDTDPDGAADLATAVIVTPPIGATAAVDAVGNVTFTAADAGTYTFTYQAQDIAGGLSANTATVTVNVINVAAEVVTVIRAQFRASRSEWRVDGTSTVPGPGNTITIHVGDINGTELGTADVDAAGLWSFRERGSATLPGAATTVTVQSTGGVTATGALTIRP